MDANKKIDAFLNQLGQLLSAYEVSLYFNDGYIEVRSYNPETKLFTNRKIDNALIWKDFRNYYPEPKEKILNVKTNR